MIRTLQACAATMLVAAVLSGQETVSPDRTALARAKLLEEQEGDLNAAKDAYRALLDGKGDAAVQAEAALRLGTMLWRLDQKEEARPFLSRAVEAGGEIGVQAQAVLQGQGPNSAQEAEIAARVRDVLDRMLAVKPRTGDPIADLRWLGQAAVPTLVRELETRRAVEAEHGNMGVEGTGEVASWIWTLGGPDAERYLRAAIANPDLEWRRLVSSRSKSANEELLPLVEVLLRDPDPEVVGNALAACDRLPLQSVFMLTDSPLESARKGAWACLRQRSDLVAPAGPLPEKIAKQVEPFVPTLLRAIDGNDPEPARTALFLLQRLALSSGTAVEQILERLPSLSQVTSGPRVATPRLDKVVRAARQLGPYASTGQRQGACVFLAYAARPAVQTDPERTASQILELVELGYDHSDDDFLTEAVKVAADPGDLVRAAGLLPLYSRPIDAARQLADRDLPVEAFPLLAQRVLACLPELPAEEASPKNSKDEATKDYCVALLAAITRTGSPEVVGFLRQLAHDRPDFLDSVILAAALPLAQHDATSEVSALLREFLLTPGLMRSTRNIVFAELLRRGEVQAIELYPKAIELGIHASYYLGYAESGKPLRGMQWLMAIDKKESVGSEGIERQQQLDRMWLTLFESDALLPALPDLAEHSFPNRVKSLLAPVLARRLPELLAALPEHQVFAADQDRETGPTRASLFQVCRFVVRGTPVEDDPTAQEYRAAVDAILGNETIDPSIGNELPYEVMPRFAARLLDLLVRRQAERLLGSMVVAGITIEPAVWLELLRSDRKYEVLNVVAEDRVRVTPELRRGIEGLLTDEDVGVRVVTCTVLGRLLSAESVSALLAALRDPNERVSKAATDALQRIRLYHEQTAFWQQFQEGITTGREAATAKLLAQAKPDQPKEQRLLALRSLGVLGAPEALPYLIEWTSDSDAEIAAAARAAVAQIHQTAGTGK